MKRLKKIIITLVGVWLLAHIIFVLTDTTYVYRAIWYNFVDIDDLSLFHNRTVKAGEGDQWLLSKRYNQIPLSETLKNELPP